MKILISLIGKEVIGNFRVFKHIQPDMLLNIFSLDTKSYEQQIAKQAKKTACNVTSIGLKDGFSFDECLAKLKTFKVKNDSVLYANITGGTKPMTLALYEYAKQLNCKVKIVYLDTKQNLHNLLEGGITELDTQITLEEFISLQGQEIKSKDNYTDQKNKYSEISDSINEILKNDTTLKIWRQFLDKVVAKIRKLQQFKSETTKQILKRTNLEFNDFQIQWDKSTFQISYKKSVFFTNSNLEEKDIDRFIFNAGWYEFMVAEYFNKTYSSENIFMNVIFPVLSLQKEDKNEVDILINDGGKLIFIECKSGFVKTTDLDKIEIRKKTYGGLIAKSILAVHYPISSTNHSNRILLEKCRELNIEIVKI